jgi:uncharacterized protein (TIGR03435 family)
VSQFEIRRDLHLEWTEDPPNAVATDVSDRPTIFNALVEQLGLRLVSAKGPVEVIVIDRVQKPTSN